jgi:hypothetical protein
MTATMSACDAYRQGYIGWEYKSYDPITGDNKGCVLEPNLLSN